jgi:phosphate/sulfate permease
LGAGVYVGWNIGANDTANCIGLAAGADINYAKLITIAASWI